MNGKKFKILPEKDNFIRLRNCDFNILPERNNERTNPSNYLKDFTELSRIPCTLKKITNPILILFYYNETHEKILTEFYESSYGKDLQGGDEKDKLFENKDREFKFGFVNLDLEKGIEETFKSMDSKNPFAWADTRNSKEAFILFYYQSLPQINYEGIVDSNTIKEEFKNWRKELMELEVKEQDNKIPKDGYYKAMQDGYPDPEIKKGKVYWISVTKTGSDYNYSFTLIN